MLGALGSKLPKFMYTEVAITLKRENESKLVKKLKANLSPTYISVKDMSLGAQSCGPMYKIIVESEAFIDKSKLEQHKMVIEALSDDMELIHAVNLKTRVPTPSEILGLNIGAFKEQMQESIG